MSSRQRSIVRSVSSCLENSVNCAAVNYIALHDKRVHTGMKCASRIPDNIDRLTDVLNQTMNEFRRQLGLGTIVTDQLLNRLTAIKKLPNFDGYDLEWIRLRHAFELCTDLGGYTETENVS